eukprot:179178-Pelagomonas_calceolata.AAC.1
MDGRPSPKLFTSSRIIAATAAVLIENDKVCWGTWSNCKGKGKTRTDSYANNIFGLTGGRAQEVISKGRAAQDIGK